MITTYSDFAEARADADQLADVECREYSVSGTYIDKDPVYFVVPTDTPADQVRDMAFEIREGRAPSEYELFLLEQAKQLTGLTQ